MTTFSMKEAEQMMGTVELDESQDSVCPQCDGFGQEDLKGFPEVCRRCGGAGSISAIKHVGSAPSGGEVLRKVAEDNFDDFLGDTSPEEGTPSEQDVPQEGGGVSYEATGMEGEIPAPKDMSEGELRWEIGSRFGNASEALLGKAFDKVAELQGIAEDEKSKRGKNPQGEIDTSMVKDYIYPALDTLNKEQLRRLLATMILG